MRVSTTQDDVDGVFADAATVAATTGATVVMHHARTRQEQLALAERLGQAQKPQRFWDRFTRQHEDALRDIRNPMPKGLQGTVQPDEWASWTAEQRDMVDPDHVGRWATDYQSATPGASLRSTADQINRADVLANALGTDSALQSAVNVASLDRLGAAGCCASWRRISVRTPPRLPTTAAV